VRRGMWLVGVDALSVDPIDTPGPVHRVLLEAGVIIVEGLALAGVPPGRYRLTCLPLRLENGDGAPCRAILVSRSGRRPGTRSRTCARPLPVAAFTARCRTHARG
jgi:arylformamidase